jgi:hypothetical protein
MVRLLALVSLSLIDQPVPPAPAAAACVRLEGAQIGQLPLVLSVAGSRVEFREWKVTDITALEQIGYAVEAPKGTRFTVEAGSQVFEASANWLHPAGVVGPSVRPIRALTVCAP